MKRSFASVIFVSIAALLLGGCASWAHKSTSYRTSPRARTIALAITVNGVLQPTPAQYAAIQAQAVKQFGAMGYTLVTDLSLAEQILRVDFTPNPNDPESSGRATILGFRSNPYYASARNPSTSPYPTSFGFAGSFSNTNWAALNNFGYGYYGYGNSYYDGYSYSSPNLNPARPTVVTTTKPVTPPFRHDHCPPEAQRVQPITGRFLAEFTPVTNNYPPSSSRDPGRWRGGGESTGSAALSSSGSGSTYASSSGGSQGSSDSGSRSWWRGGERSGDSDSRGSWRSENRTSDSGSRGSWRSEDRTGDSGSRGSWRSDSSNGGSRSERTYSRSDSGYSRSDSSHSRSESYHSRAEPSHSSSSSSSSMSSGGGSSPSSSPSSSVSVGTADGNTNTHQR